SAVFLARPVGDLGVVEGGGGGLLHGRELAGVRVVLDVSERLDDSWVPGNEGHAPADHVEPLGQGKHLDADLPCALDLEKTQRRGVEAQEQVGRVLDHDDFVGPGERNYAAVEVASCDGARGAVGVIEHQQFRPAADVGGDGVEVGEKAILLPQGKVVDVAAVIASVGPGDRIPWHSHECDVAGVDKGGRQHGEGWL